MKKINVLCLILALVMVIGLFAGCGAEKPADTTAAPVADNEGTPAPVVDDKDYKYGTVHGVTWTNGGKADAADATAVQREEERNAMYFLDTGNTRECVAFSYNYDTVGALFEGGQMPTVFGVAATEPMRLVDAGWGRDITSAVEKVGINLDDFNQAILATYKDENGAVYGLPQSAYSMCLVANAALYREAGIVDANGNPKAPETWDEIITQSAEIKAKTGKGGLALQCSDRQGGWFFTNIAWNFGADLCVWNEEAGKFESGINSQATIDALTWWQKACASDAIVGAPATDNRSANQAMLKSGEASLILGASDFAPGMTDNTKDGMPATDICYFNMPAGPNGDQYNLMGGSGYWFSSSATDEQVVAVLEYLIHYGTFVQEWTEEAKSSNIQSWTDEAVKAKAAVLPFPVYNAPYQEEYNAKLLEIYGGDGTKYDFQAQFGAVWEQANKVGAMHPEEECDCQNLYQELTNIMQELSVNPEADVAALVAQADANYADLLVVAQGG
jgi:ABC-type glycerol-3-phosphate transport system substrate-binding protein